MPISVSAAPMIFSHLSSIGNCVSGMSVNLSLTPNAHIDPRRPTEPEGRGRWTVGSNVMLGIIWSHGCWLWRLALRLLAKLNTRRYNFQQGRRQEFVSAS